MQMKSIQGASKAVTSESAKAQPHVPARLLASVAILSFVFLFITMPRDIIMYDEGIVLSDAIRVLNGDIIHRDFYSIYGPGQYYVVAALFHTFGETFLIARAYDIAMRAASITMLFYILRKQCRPPVTLIFTAAGAMWLLAVENYLYPIFPCMLLSLISSYLVTRVDRQPALSHGIVGAGASTGLTALFRYDVGLFLFIAHVASIAVFLPLSQSHRPNFRRTATAVAAYSAGAALVFAPAAIAFLMISPIEAFLRDIVAYPMRYYALMRGLPFPSLYSVEGTLGVVYLPLLAVGLGLPQAIRLAARRMRSSEGPTSDDRVLAYLIVFGSSATLLYLKGLVRPSNIHVLLGTMPALVLLAVLVDLWCRRGVPMRYAAEALLLLVLIPATVVATLQLSSIIQIPNRSIAGWLAIQANLITLPAEARGVCESGPASGIAKLRPDYSRVANYLGTHVRPGEPIFVALGRHDKIWVNPIVLYFVVGRPPGTHWHQFDPGLQTRADIQAAIIDDLKLNSVRWVVRDASYDDMREPNGSAQSSGVKLLDAYLDKNYRLVASSGKVGIWLANEERPDAHPSEKCEALPVNAGMPN